MSQQLRNTIDSGYNMRIQPLESTMVSPHISQKVSTDASQTAVHVGANLNRRLDEYFSIKSCIIKIFN